MYTSFSVKNFRAFQDFTIGDLPRINLIAGQNNSGKTSLLEAFFIHAGGYNPELGLRVNAFRGLEIISVRYGGTTLTLWDSLFNSFNASKEVIIAGKYDPGKAHTITLGVVDDPEELAKVIQTFRQGRNGAENASFTSENIPVLGLRYQDGKSDITTHLVIDTDGVHAQAHPPAPVDAIFLAARSRISAKEDATRYGSIVRLRQEDIVLEALKVIDDRIMRLEAIPSGDTTVMYVDTPEHEQLVPLSVMGDGMNRLFSILVAMGSRKGGVILVDEIENGLHYSVLKDVWSAIHKAAIAFDTQIIATTHSFEAIRAAHQAFSESEPYDYKLHRLDRTKNDIKVSTFDEETLDAALEMNLEVR